MAFDRSMPVLVVDDDDMVIRIIRTLLQILGFVNVDDANDVGDALTKIRVKRYGFAILDWDMEAVNNCDLLREVRGDPDFSRTPFIATGESRPENVIASKKAGAHSYIVKPFNIETLKAKIEAALTTRTVLLTERPQADAAPQLRSSEPEFSVATPNSPAARQKFKGRITGSL